VEGGGVGEPAAGVEEEEEEEDEEEVGHQRVAVAAVFGSTPALVDPLRRQLAPLASPTPPPPQTTIDEQLHKPP